MVAGSSSPYLVPLYTRTSRRPPGRAPFVTAYFHFFTGLTAKTASVYARQRAGAISTPRFNELVPSFTNFHRDRLKTLSADARPGPVAETRPQTGPMGKNVSTGGNTGCPVRQHRSSIGEERPKATKLLANRSGVA